MKKSILFLGLILISIISIKTSSAQMAKFWLFTNGEVAGEKGEAYIVLEFNENKEIKMGPWAAGTWDYNSKKKTLTIESEMLDKLHGKWEVAKLTDDELELKRKDAKMYFLNFDTEKLSVDNKDFEFLGSWKIDGEDGVYLSFELPNISKRGNTIKTKERYWFYNKEENTITIIYKAFAPGKKMKIEKQNDNSILLVNNDGKMKLTRIINDTSGREIIAFPSDEDPDFNKNIESFAWSNYDNNIANLKSVKRLVYNRYELLKTFNFFDSTKSGTNIKYDEAANEIEVELLFIVGNNKYNDYKSSPTNLFFPLLKPEGVKQLEDATIEVPAGSFDCQVVEAKLEGGKTIARLYLIKDKPGVYARMVFLNRNNLSDDIKYIVYELSEIR